MAKKCKYTIHIPGQRDPIVIPSDIGLLTEGDDIYNNVSELVNELNSEDSRSIDVIASDIKNKIDALTGLKNISNYEIVNILKNNDNIKDISNSINNLIESKTTYRDFYKSLKTYLIKNPDKYSTLFNKVNTKPDISYFTNKTQEFAANNRLMFLSNLDTEINKLRYKVSDSNSTHLNNILVFLNELKNINILDGESNLLLGYSNEFGLKSVNHTVKDTTYSFFKFGDYDSLYLSLFKRLANTIDISDLNDILVNNKLKKAKSVNEFFNNIDNSEFENLLSDKKYNKVISEIITLISNIHFQSSELSNYFSNINKRILQELNPYSYGILKSDLKIINESFDIEENINYNEIILDLHIANSEKFKVFTENRGEFYSEPHILSDIDYTKVINTIEKGTDLVKFNLGNITPYVFVTAIRHRDRTGGVYIEGFYKKEDGTYSKVNQVFQNGSKISYMKQEQLFPSERNNDSFITINDKLPINSKQDFIKDYLLIGDTVTSKKLGKVEGTVTNMFPGYIEVNHPKKGLINIKYSEIGTFNSSKLYSIHNNDFNNINSFIRLDDLNLISKGDVIERVFNVNGKEYKRRHAVILVDKDNIYVTSINNDNNFVQIVPKEEIVNAWTDSFMRVPASEYDDIKNNTRFGSSSEYSFLSSPENLVTGDFVYSKINGADWVGKVYDNKVILFNGFDLMVTTKNDDRLKNSTYLTKRNIQSSYALSTIRMNHSKISFLSNISDKNQEAMYVVPKGTNQEDLILISDTHAQIGWYESVYDKEGNKRPIKEGFINGTNMIRNLISTKRNIGNLKPYLESTAKGNFRFVRDTRSTVRIARFENLSTSVKKELNVLQPGTYFELANNTKNSFSDIYRIEKVLNGQIVAHSNRINRNGKIITNEKIFEIDTLLAEKIDGKLPDGAISSLYVQRNNNKLNTLFITTNQSLNLEQFKSYKDVEELVNKMKSIYGDLVKVKVDFSGEGFTNKQRAKISSTENGDIEIVLNGLVGDKSDLVHENLHIILTALRITDLNRYGELIQAVVGENNDSFRNREEAFVERIINAVAKDNTLDFLGDNLEEVLQGLYDVVAKIAQENNTKLNFNFDQVNINPYLLLNQKMKDLFNIKGNLTSKYANLSVLQSEPTFRQWLDDNNVNLKCK